MGSLADPGEPRIPSSLIFPPFPTDPLQLGGNKLPAAQELTEGRLKETDAPDAELHRVLDSDIGFPVSPLDSGWQIGQEYPSEALSVNKNCPLDTRYLNRRR